MDRTAAGQRCLARFPMLEWIGSPDAAETVDLLLEHLAANSRTRMASPSAPSQTTIFRT